MDGMIRSHYSTLGKALVLGALALTLVGDTSFAFDSQESGGSEQTRRRHPNELTFTQIDFPGAVLTGPLGINDRGQIVGVFVDTAGIGRGFLLSDGIFTEITRPDGSPTMAIGINDRGQIVGTFVDAADVLRGYLLDRGVFTQIDFPGATFTQPQMINNRGQIVGSFADVGGVVHNFLFVNGTFSQINFPGAAPNPTDAGNAIGINDRGQIVSQFTDAGGVLHGYILENNIFTQFDVPDATATGASDINNRGQIVGAFGDAGGGVHGYLFDGDVFTQFDFPGGTGVQTGAINDRGQVVGISIDFAGALHGFLASKEQFNGNAIGVGAGQDKTAIELAGTFTSPTDLDLSASTLTITNLLHEQAGGGELARGLPLVLTAVPGSRRNVARFVNQSRPNFASVTILDAGPGRFIFKFKIDDATINSPQSCSPTLLTTGFRLDAAGKPPIIVSTERSWDCSGPSSGSLKAH
jgi:uncharacterized membrane protein